MNGLPFSHVSLTLLFDDLLWNAEADISIDASTSVSIAITGLFGIALARSDFIAQEFGCAVPRVGDQRFLLREFQLELVTEKRPESLFDLLCLCFGANEC